MKKMIIRADDLGYSEGTNCGIAKSVKDGLVKNVGVMPNMPEAAHGLQLLEGLDVCLGQHTNICFGKPLCDPKKIPSLVGPDGNFKSSREYRSAAEDFVNLEEVILEIEAQYARFKELTGKEPAYFEGHAVQSDAFNRGLEIVAKRHHLDYQAFSMEDAVPFRDSWLQVEMGSMDPAYDPDAFIRSVAAKEYPANTIPVIVLHPGYLDATILRCSSMQKPRVLEVEAATDPALEQWLKEQDVQLLQYADI